MLRRLLWRSKLDVCITTIAIFLNDVDVFMYVMRFFVVIGDIFVAIPRLCTSATPHFTVAEQKHARRLRSVSSPLPTTALPHIAC
jgi:hypothetical protein